MPEPTWEEALQAQAVDADEVAPLAGAYRAKPELAAVVRAESARLLKGEHDALSRIRWFKRWRLRGIAKVLAREEEAYRASRSADR